MIIEIEYYKYDTKLIGKSKSLQELENEIKDIELKCDDEIDDFISLFCSEYGWQEIRTEDIPDYVYDRDIQSLNKIEHM